MLKSFGMSTTKKRSVTEHISLDPSKTTCSLVVKKILYGQLCGVLQFYIASKKGNMLGFYYKGKLLQSSSIQIH